MVNNPFGALYRQSGFDVMQVCENGHQITSILKSKPELGKKFCPKCGAKTLSECATCKQAIPGKEHVPGVHDPTPVPIPNRCSSCGAEYPWTVSPESKRFLELIGAFNKFIQDSSTISIWRIGITAYARLNASILPHPSVLCATLNEFYWVILRSSQDGGDLTGARLAAYIKWATHFVRSFETGIKEFLQLMEYADKTLVGKDYSELSRAYNEWIKDWEELLVRVGSAHTFMRFPALVDLPTRPAPPVGGTKAYAPGDAYDLYKDIKEILSKATKDVFIVEPYPADETFELYLEKVPAGVQTRLLIKNAKTSVVHIAKKFLAKPGISVEIRQTTAIHDRMFFVDGRCWACGRSSKHAALTDPTYLGELEDAAIELRKHYDNAWAAAKPI